ncbi:HpcH/HpaI aldolase/citrate lyase family protein [Glaciibacter flavus]|uniref:HpcH/HpaI aldolase/citrate lyase family protein n=1 Tax=Orlajensenia flava TaxID=2565934 RepID=UPI003B00CE68
MSLPFGPALLFCPGDRPERYQKALERADAIIIDLEDAVGHDDREYARECLVSTQLDPDRTIVRINPIGSHDAQADLSAVEATAYRYVMVPKAESAEQMRAVSGLQVLALCETARGVLAAPAVAAEPNVVGLMWGAEDLVASLGGTGSRRADGSYRPLALHARSAILLATGAAGIAAIDTVHLDIADVAGLTEEAEDAAASGFAATACIHPSQVAVIRDAYRPADDEVERAREIIAAAAAEHGVFRHGDRMVDAPLLRHAEAVIRRADRR